MKESVPIGLALSGLLQYAPSYGWTGRLIHSAVAFVIMAMLVPVAPALALDRPIKIVALGDSLTAGLGLPAAEAFPARLEQALKTRGYAVSIENAGVSGDTTMGGLSRLDWSVPPGTDGVILELGANDALRGIDPKLTRANLDKIVQQLRARNVTVLLCGMRAPRNLGADYAAAFDPIYPDIAGAQNVLLYPFFLEGVAVDAKFTQADGMHPNAAGVQKIVEAILPKTEELIARIRDHNGS